VLLAWLLCGVRVVGQGVKGHPWRGVLQLAAEGSSTRQIAAELHYSEQNVGYHLGQLREKMRGP